MSGVQFPLEFPNRAPERIIEFAATLPPLHEQSQESKLSISLDQYKKIRGALIGCNQDFQLTNIKAVPETPILGDDSTKTVTKTYQYDLGKLLQALANITAHLGTAPPTRMEKANEIRRKRETKKEKLRHTFQACVNSHDDFMRAHAKTKEMREKAIACLKRRLLSPDASSDSDSSRSSTSRRSSREQSPETIQRITHNFADNDNVSPHSIGLSSSGDTPLPDSLSSTARSNSAEDLLNDPYYAEEACTIRQQHIENLHAFQKALHAWRDASKNQRSYYDNILTDGNAASIAHFLDGSPANTTQEVILGFMSILASKDPSSTTAQTKPHIPVLAINNFQEHTAKMRDVLFASAKLHNSEASPSRLSQKKMTTNSEDFIAIFFPDIADIERERLAISKILRSTPQATPKKRQILRQQATDPDMSILTRWYAQRVATLRQTASQREPAPNSPSINGDPEREALTDLSLAAYRVARGDLLSGTRGFPRAGEDGPSSSCIIS